MPVSKPKVLKLFVPVFLLAQALTIYIATGGELLPAPPDLSKLPKQVGEWTQVRDERFDAEVEAKLRADRLISRTYVHATAGTYANLFIAWFQTQRGGDRQPHSPKVCLPGAGWTQLNSGEMVLDTSAGAITINRFIVGNRLQRSVVLYWYQTPRGVIAGELDAKLAAVTGALRDRRTDTAIVRVEVPVQDKNDEKATALAVAFSRDIYPLLRDTLPR